ncbi:hypothetical protein CBR_g32339 [Chara braunii]|uniref:Uncharacterized protein n=1 Tax=Chara braunii TaxID=69332 RepID=A0A388JNG5_CHABU|nr:hypothetical protein CBR_g32339 [Chara braunii]|eukprot:GBG59327.1 hypothetical protein CBR_g32339 [Chara braunii]
MASPLAIRAVPRWKNWLVAGSLSAFAGAVYLYTMKAVASDDIDRAVAQVEREKAMEAKSQKRKVKVSIKDFRKSTGGDQGAEGGGVIKGILDVETDKLQRDPSGERACLAVIVCGEDGEYYSDPCTAADFGIPTSPDYSVCEGKPQYSLVACDSDGVCHADDDDDDDDEAEEEEEEEGAHDDVHSSSQARHARYDHDAEEGAQLEGGVGEEKDDVNSTSSIEVHGNGDGENGQHNLGLSHSLRQEEEQELGSTPSSLSFRLSSAGSASRPRYVPGPVHLFLRQHVPVPLPNHKANGEHITLDVNTWLRSALVSTDIPPRVTSVVFWVSHTAEGGALYLLLKRAEGGVCLKTVDVEKQVDISFDCGPGIAQAAQYAKFHRGTIQKAKNRDFNDARLVYLRTGKQSASCFNSLVCARYHRNGTLTYVGHATHQSIAATSKPFLLYTNRGAELEVVDYTTASPPKTKRRYAAIELLHRLDQE